MTCRLVNTIPSNGESVWCFQLEWFHSTMMFIVEWNHFKNGSMPLDCTSRVLLATLVRSSSFLIGRHHLSHPIYLVQSTPSSSSVNKEPSDAVQSTRPFGIHNGKRKCHKATRTSCIVHYHGMKRAVTMLAHCLTSEVSWVSYEGRSSSLVRHNCAVDLSRNGSTGIIICSP